MVQLKVSIRITVYLFIYISIPHGTIKSGWNARPVVAIDKFQYLMVQLKVQISKCINMIGWFQYLMVQLKDGIQLGEDGIRVFQYLMVQLKERESGSCQKRSVFQYLMVQLKDCLTSRLYSERQISIPHGTIKSLHGLHHRRHVLHFNTSWYN